MTSRSFVPPYTLRVSTSLNNSLSFTSHYKVNMNMKQKFFGLQSPPSNGRPERLTIVFYLFASFVVNPA